MLLCFVVKKTVIWTMDFRDILYLYFSLYSAYCLLHIVQSSLWLQY